MDINNYSVSNTRTTESYTPPTPTIPDPIAERIDSFTKDKYVIEFIGFSGKGYAEMEKLKLDIGSVLQTGIDKHGAGHLLVVTGGTPEGVGCAAEVAKSMDIQTLGIVSVQAKNDIEKNEKKGIQNFCNDIVYVPDPLNLWTVKSPAGESYTVRVVAKESAELHVYNGGNIARGELIEATERGVNIHRHTEFGPKDPNDPNPVLEWFNENDNE
ncbi:hypothetical protein ACVBEF_10725 [Glaciimonas sp. GG7]